MIIQATIHMMLAKDTATAIRGLLVEMHRLEKRIERLDGIDP